MIAVLGVIFLVPWVIIAVVQIRKRHRRVSIQKQKEFQAQQLLMVTTYGRELRYTMRGPGGELYADPDARESRFRKVDNFAPDRVYVDVA